MALDSFTRVSLMAVGRGMVLVSSSTLINTCTWAIFMLVNVMDLTCTSILEIILASKLKER